MDTILLAQLFEAGMLICFGASWPLNAYKSWKARTAKGNNWQFFALVITGYLLGTASHLVVDPQFTWIIIVYLINIAFLFLNIGVYIRNLKLDKARAIKRAEKIIDYTEQLENAAQQ